MKSFSKLVTETLRHMFNKKEVKVIWFVAICAFGLGCYLLYGCNHIIHRFPHLEAGETISQEVAWRLYGVQKGTVFWIMPSFAFWLFLNTYFLFVVIWKNRRYQESKNSKEIDK